MSFFLSMIIPAHNEERRLPPTLTAVNAYLNRQAYISEIIVVENGSQDLTAVVAEAFAADHPRVRLIRESARGKGLAVRRGMLEARGAYRFICDADLSMPIEEVAKFLPPQLSGYDVAIGSREAPGAATTSRSTATSRAACSATWSKSSPCRALRTPSAASNVSGAKSPKTCSAFKGSTA